jgi:hypothetical protein
VKLGSGDVPDHWIDEFFAEIAKIFCKQIKRIKLMLRFIRLINSIRLLKSLLVAVHPRWDFGK